MSNDTSTLNGSLLEMKDQLIYELGQKGVTASFDPSTGLLGLISKIGDISQSSYHIEFNSSSYEASGGSATISCTLQEDYAPKSGATVTFTGSDSSSYTGLTNSSGVASVTVTGLTTDTVFTCSYSNVTDTVTVTVPASLITTTLTSIQLVPDDFAPSVNWKVKLTDINDNAINSKTVKFYIDNVLKTSQPTGLQMPGEAELNNASITYGTHTIKAVFEGDETYDGCEVSTTFTIEDPFGGGLF